MTVKDLAGGKAWDPTATTAASSSPIASLRESRRANASNDDDMAEAFVVVNVIVALADEQRRRWPSIAIAPAWRQNLRRGHNDNDDIAAAVRQLTI